MSGVIAVLMAVLIPVGLKARQSAERAEELATLKQYAVALFSYEIDHQGRLPFFGEPRRPVDDLVFESGRVGTGTAGSAAIVLHTFYWCSAIVPYMSSWDGLPYRVRLWPAPLFDDLRETGAFQSPVYMTSSAFADASLWRQSDTYSKDGYRPQTVAAARYPSRKILLSAFGARDTDGMPVVMVDRSVQLVDPATIRPGFEPTGLFPFSINTHLPGAATLNGFSGFDF
ncbi:MAG: hypothetical protein ACR2GY_13835 [Phycisphaerales bacterium]